MAHVFTCTHSSGGGGFAFTCLRRWRWRWRRYCHVHINYVRFGLSPLLLFMLASCWLGLGLGLGLTCGSANCVCGPFNHQSTSCKNITFSYTQTIQQPMFIRTDPIARMNTQTHTDKECLDNIKVSASNMLARTSTQNRLVASTDSTTTTTTTITTATAAMSTSSSSFSVRHIR